MLMLKQLLPFQPTSVERWSLIVDDQHLHAQMLVLWAVFRERRRRRREKKPSLDVHAVRVNRRKRKTNNIIIANNHLSQYMLFIMLRT